MSNDKDGRIRDEKVADVYRGHSTECAPPDLNEKILAMAAAEANQSRRGFSFLNSWTRPLAVAATVLLSLAIVLRVSELPDAVTPTEAPLVTAPAKDAQDAVMPETEAPTTLEEEFRLKDTSVLEDARNQARLRAGPNRNDGIELSKDEVTPLQVRQESNEIANDTDSLNPAAPQADNARPLGQAASSSAKRSADLPSSEEQPAVSAREAAAPSAFTALSVSPEEIPLDAKSLCDEAREVAEDWLNCIDALRRMGAEQRADDEYEQFLLKFPAE